MSEAGRSKRVREGFGTAVRKRIVARIGRETVQYVSNIYKYWIAYSMIVERDKMRKKASSQ